MARMIFLFASLLFLSSCSFMHVHKMEVQQGNILPPEKVSQLHPGMTITQVNDLLGTPVLTNSFRNNRIDYVYTYKPGYGDMAEKYMTLIFTHGRLTKIENNMYSQFIK